MEFLKTNQFDNKIRLGCKHDGGYIIAELEGNYDCYISAGISNEESFSRDFIKKYGMNEFNSFGFDGTIYRYPYEYTTNISFIPKNISDVNDDFRTNLDNIFGKFDNIFLKMDIEGGEYKWLSYISLESLQKIKQLVIEFHGINNDDWGTCLDTKLKCFEKLSKTHYIIHAHGNNFGGVNDNKIPNVIELTYIRKDQLKNPIENTLELPSFLDLPNNKHLPEIDLNFYPFVKT